MRSYPLFRKENIPAYVTVVAIWIVLSLAFASGLRTVATSLSFRTSLIWSLVSVMAGMMIMFGASLLNLRKLGPGFRRLADGAEDPAIPPVWCPVLTAATNAAIELAATTRRSPRSTVTTHIALYVADLNAAIPFYEQLFDTSARRPRPAYAELEIGDPPFRLALQEITPRGAGAVNHLGLQFASKEQLERSRERLKKAGWPTRDDASETCGAAGCHPRVATSWVTAPDGTRWELYVEKPQQESTTAYQEDSTQ